MARSHRHPLHAFFARFLRSPRHPSALPPPVDARNFGGSPHERAVPADQAQTLRQAAISPPTVLLGRLHGGRTRAALEAAHRLRKRVGPNEIEQEGPLPWWQLLWHCYRTPFDLLLSLLALISWLTGDLRATVVIGSMVTLSVSLRFVQERRSHHAADQLKALVSNRATVVRRVRPQ